MTPEKTDTEQTLRSAQLEELQLKNEKLQFELNEIRKGKSWNQTLIQLVPVFTAIIALAGFAWGLIRYQDEQAKARKERTEQSKRDQDAREREYMKPWLENQRELYRKALSAAGTLANTESSVARQQASEEFWRLYHGEMILVETTLVSNAMVAFGNCLDGARVTCAKSDINDRSHILGSAMHDSMAATARMTFQEFAKNQFRYQE